jgi:acetyl esterase
MADTTQSAAPGETVPPHPQVAAFLASLAEFDGPALYEMEPAAAREAASGFLDLVGPGPEVASVRDLTIPTSGGSTPARLYEPENPRSGLAVYIHGGGWVLGDLEWCDPICRRMANAARMRFLSVDYRLAPEHKFPAAIDDVTDAIRWAVAELDVDGPLVVSGDSAGGNLAAVVARRFRDAGGPPIALQVLVYPVIAPDFETASYVRNGHAGLPLGLGEMEYFWDAYTTEETRTHPDANPLQAETLAGLPPALVIVAGYDPLRDEGLTYAARLKDAGVPTEAIAFEDMNHGFFNLINFFERADEAVDLVAERLAALD